MKYKELHKVYSTKRRSVGKFLFLGSLLRRKLELFFSTLKKEVLCPR